MYVSVYVRKTLNLLPLLAAYEEEETDGIEDEEYSDGGPGKNLQLAIVL